MQGKTLIVPGQKPVDSTRTQTSRFRLRNKLPLVGALAVSLAFGVGAIAIDGSQPSLDGKVRAWHSELGFSKGCDTVVPRKVLSEVQEELNRRMEARDSESLEGLFDVERAAIEIYNSSVRDPKCPKDAGR